MPSDSWKFFDFRGTGTWPETWPPVEWRAKDEAHFEFRATPKKVHGNQFGHLHGGFLASYAENCAGIPVVGLYGKQNCVTVNLSLSYPSSGRVDVEINGDISIVNETRRMMFVRLSLRQENATILHGDCLLRKIHEA